MSVAFNPHRGLIVVTALLEGPVTQVTLDVAVDTGATDTVLDLGLLIAAGYDAALAPNQVPMVSGTGMSYVPSLTVTRLTALGQSRATFPVLGHTFPPATSIDGVLGLDFLRGGILTIDFRSGQITLT